MPQKEIIILTAMGVLFLVGGIVFLIGGTRSARNYYESLSYSSDARKFMERRARPKYESVKIGARIAIAAGIIMLVTGIFIWVLG